MSNDIKKYMKLMESAQNPLNVKVEKCDRDGIDAELKVRDDQVEGSFSETDKGEYRFKSDSKNFEEYNGMEFEDLKTAEEFFVDMTQNDEFYEK